MDPFLEDAAGWTSVHHRLITVLGDMLTEQVAPDYYVAIEERVYITDPANFDERQLIAPDLYLVERPAALPSPESSSRAGIIPPAIIEPLPTLEVRDRFLEIRDQRSRAIVTTIELLSPRNKARRSKGRKAFLAKRQAVFAAQTHWIEIDLLRAGERPSEIAKTDYYALLHRANDAARLAVWYFNLRDTMPSIAVPLRPERDDAVLTLQSALDTVYARARYADALDYTQPVPPPTLAPADTSWVAERLAHWRVARAGA
jgi:hypothetical protein